MTKWGVIRWWELRRLPYNAILFAIGIASIFAMDFFAQKVNSVGDAPELGTGLTIVLYGFMANVCYTFGWIAELVGRKKDEALARSRAKKHFSLRAVVLLPFDYCAILVCTCFLVDAQESLNTGFRARRSAEIGRWEPSWSPANPRALHALTMASGIQRLEIRS